MNEIRQFAHAMLREIYEQPVALATDVIQVQPVGEYLLPIEEVVPLQMFSYFIAVRHGVDVDRPRNLVKAVVTE